MLKHVSWILIAINGFALGQQQSSVTYLRADPNIVQRMLSPVPGTRHDRVEALRHQFDAAKVYGPLQVEQQSVPGEAEPNLICTLRGSTESTIIIGVNNSYKASGDEEKVNWGTLEMLPLLAQSLAGFPPRHTLVFIAFGGASGKHSGAGSYWEQLSKEQQKNIATFVELDHIGRVAPSFAPGDGGYDLGRRLALAAWALKSEEIPRFFSARSPTGTVIGRILGEGSIAEIFNRAKIPAITIYSRNEIIRSVTSVTSYEAMPSKFAKIDPKAYYDTYVLLCVYMRQLDRDLGSE
jgi:hypothetical protein